MNGRAKTTLSSKFSTVIASLFALFLFASLLIFVGVTAIFRETITRSECRNLEKSAGAFSFQIAREIALNEKDTASALLEKFRHELDSTSQAKEVRLSLEDKNAASAWHCDLNLDSLVFRMPMVFGDTQVGTLAGSIRIISIPTLILVLVSVLFFIGACWLLVVRKVLTAVERDIIGPISSLANSNFQTGPGKQEVPVEIGAIQDSLLESHNALMANERVLAELKGQQELAKLARQVSHDIRSPLTALNMVLGSSVELSEAKRSIVRGATQRINDIANSLLQENKFVIETDHSPVMLLALLDSIVSEKRIQFRDEPGVKIDFHKDGGYGLFANIDAGQFARAISNVVNNAVEALSNGGSVVVNIRSSGTKIHVTVEDNGKGIPPHILSRLGERGVTYGKAGTQSGSGLGVYHARQTAEKAGGQLSVQSKVGEGTLVTLTLPKSESPGWFVSEIDLREKLTLVSLDDDPTIHQIWWERLRNAGAKHVTHVRFSKIEEFETWFPSSKIRTRIQYLVDYELLNQPANGLDIVEKLNIAKDTILVTSRYEERAVRERARRMGVPILPKVLAPLVPMIID